MYAFCRPGQGCIFYFVVAFGFKEVHGHAPWTEICLVDDNEVTEGGADSSTLNEIDRKELIRSLQELAELVKMYDIKAEDYFAEHKNKLYSIFPAESRELAAKLSEFKFDESNTIIEQIIGSI